MVPRDWMVEPLANIANTASGGTPSRSNESFYKGSIKWFTTTELKDCNLYNSVEHISKQAVECSSAKIFPKDTLLMAMYGATIGKLGLLKCDAATNQACCAIFPKKADVLYLYYILLHNRENIIAMGCGAGQPNVSQEIVKKINIPLPPTIKEQQRIASALSDVDTLIANLEKLIAKKKNIKQGAMQQLLTGRKRLPGFAPAKPTYKQTELGKIPTDWEVKKLSSVCTIIMGQSPDSKYYNEKEGTPLIQGNADIENRETFVRFYTTQITKKGLKGDLILTVRAPVGSVAKATFDCCLGRGVCALRNANDFLYQYLIYIEKEWAKRSAGSTFDSIKSDELSATLVVVPSSKDEQSAIANVLSDMDTEIATLETKLAKYRKLKTGMMQQLLTGKIRLV